MSKKFNYAVGNPAYNADFSKSGDNGNYAAPVYDKFIDEAIKVADKVEMVHPARFLFNAGSTPKSWNEKMLMDKHFKILHYEPDATQMFANTDIKGGIVISYHDNNKDFGAIEIFTPQEELRHILHKTRSEQNVSDIGVSGYAYHFTEKMHADNPTVRSLQSKGHDYDLKSNVLDKLPMIFFEKKPEDNSEYVQIIGRANNERVIRFIKREYINHVVNLDKYKLFLPKASGTGSFGEVLAPAVFATPGMGYTETFFGLGLFNNPDEAQNLDKYLKAKFARTLLSITKKTQMITPSSFKYVPLQDFTSNSDINWNVSIKDIDKQLYKKYGLTQEEINFIETHVKEME